MAEAETVKERKKGSFVHLHLHTAFSTLDGAIKIKNLVKRIDELGMDACAITDHGNMYGIIDFYKTMKKSGLKPILGSEFYISPDSRHNKKNHYQKGESAYYHLVLLAENNVGLKNLYKLSTIGFLEGFYKKPRIDKEVLKKYSEGIIGLSACLAGEIPRKLAKDGYEKAKEAALEYAEILGKDNFFLEIQENGIPAQKAVNMQLIEISKETGIPLVATCDSHYLLKEDYSSHNVLMRIQRYQDDTNENRRPRLKPAEFKALEAKEKAEGNIVNYLTAEETSDDYGSTEDVSDPAVMQVMNDGKMNFSSMLYVKSPEEIAEDFAYCPEAVENTVKIADRCNIDIEFGNNHLPQYEVPEGYTIKTYFKELSENGLRERLKKVPEEKHEEYWKRLYYELDIIIMKGFDAYFLIVWDFINYSRKNNIPVGPGRGSGAGSLVAYSLTITDIDPIRFKLFFERFLNPERVSMPDFDIDFCIRGREQVIQYVTQKYGEDKVSQIVTFGTLKPRNAVRDVCRVYRIPLVEVDKLAKAIPEGPSITSFAKAYEADPELIYQFNKIEHGEEIRRHSENLEGLIRQVGMHAAGVVIADKPIVEYAPLAKGPKDEVIIQFEKKAAESVGLIKFDFLGLKNLTIIAEAVKRIKETVNPDFDINHIPLDDEGIFEMLRQGDTIGVFQLESDGMKSLLRRLRPTVFEDIIAVNALYRPGPIDSGMLDTFIRRKHGEEEIVYEFEELKDILEETYGVIVYQEQVMQIAQALAGYSLGEADVLRRAMGKKDKEEMEKNRDVFLYGNPDKNIPGVQNLGKDVEKARQLYNLIDKFAGYGFNKSHSAAYAYVAYQTAYLKLKYPKEYMSALLSISINDVNDVVKYIFECNRMGIEILPPDINKSYYDFQVEGNGIRFGLGAIKSAGESAINSFIKEREENGEFESIYDLCARMDYSSAANKKTIEAFIYSGSLDCFGKYRSQCAGVYIAAMEEGSKRAKDREKGFGSIEDFLTEKSEEYYPEIEEFPQKDLLKKEKDMIGFYYSNHPLKEFNDYIESFADNIEVVKSSVSECEVIVAGLIRDFRQHITREKKEKMAFIVLEDLHESVDVVVFPRIYAENMELLAEDNIIAVKGVYTPNLEDPSKSSIRAVKIMTLGQAVEELTGGIQFTINTSLTTHEKIMQLKNVLSEHNGKLPVKILLETEDKYRITMKLPEKYSIQPDIEFFDSIRRIDSNIKIDILSINEKYKTHKDKDNMELENVS